MVEEKGTVFFPDPVLWETPPDYGFHAYEDVFFMTEDGVRLHGWWIPGTDARAVLLWFHGNAGNIGYRLDNLKRLHDMLPLSTFLFDYREFGRSEGRISKAGTFLDAEAAYGYLVKERGIPENRILLFGRSLGSALAVHVAARHRPLGLILEAAFTSTDDMMRLYFPHGAPPGLSESKYDSKSLMDRVRCPVLFLHGQLDSAIPLWMPQELYEKTQAPKRFHVVRRADHNDTYVVGGEEYFSWWREFLDFCLERSGMTQDPPRE